MCGIAGLVELGDRRIDESMLQRMGRAIEHRGRDAQGIYARDNLGLVHRRLTLLDKSASANQPLHSADGRFSLVFNGEIVNFVELRCTLEAAGFIFATQSDTEVLLTAWLHWGPASVNRFRGFFAFALVDWQKRALYLVRDRVGIKPLYLYSDAGCLCFASEIKAIFASTRVEPQIDIYGLADYLAMQLYLPGRTLFKNVVSLLPGAITRIDLSNGAQRQEVYWSLPEGEEDYSLSYEETCEDIAGLIDETVGIWMRADFPIGAFISGGLDSSLVASIAARQTEATSRHGTLLSFSSVFNNPAIRDERSESDAVAAHIASDHHPIELPMAEVVADHTGLIYGLDMPVAGFSAPYRTMARHVRRFVKGALCGHGGDEFFCGYPKYLAGALTDQLNRSLQGDEVDLTILRAMPYLNGFEAQSRQMLGKSLFEDMSQMRVQSLDRSSFLIPHLVPDLVTELGGYNPFEGAEDLVRDYKGSELRKLMRLDQQLLLPGLLHVEDRTSMMENLETRPVLLDHHIIERASRIPTAYLLKNGLKSILRDVGRRTLPHTVTSNKRKSGVMFPVMSCLADPSLQEVQKAALHSLDRSGLFSRSASDLLAMENQLVNQRVTWGLWSLGDSLSSFGITLDS